ncbi:hypothetical protein ACFVTP_00940 [Streptomyces celluloflavus]|uniref:hypothetical protein n=1 Tax=Streptomyces celluloflavus TaxID=58344 RepID=UPI0036DA2749
MSTSAELMPLLACEGGRNAGEYTALVRFEMTPGTRSALISSGKTPDKIGRGVGTVHLKSERGHETFGLRAGSVEVFNSRISGFRRVGDW